MRYFTIVFFSTSLLFSDNLSNALSSQGFTGLVNTPNAQVIQEGDALFHFNNQFDNHLRNYDYSKPSVSQYDFMLGIGFLSNFEVVARLTEVDAFTKEREDAFGFEHRDLSANFKFKVPFTSKYLPNLAFGAQDIGGSANLFTNYYAVLDKEIGIFRTSLGYGKSGKNKVTNRMDGIFGGVEAKVTDWAYLLAEHDGVENHAAIRLRMPSNWTKKVKVDATIAQNLTESQTSFAVNFSIPLFHDSSKSINIVEADKRVKSNNFTSITHFKNRKISNNKQSTNEVYYKIEQKLISIGFENVQIGTYRNAIYLKCENSIFDHTDLDALGYILGTISKTVQGDKYFIVTLLKNNLQTLTVSGNSKIFKNYLKDGSQSNKIKLRDNLHFSRTFDETNVKFITKQKNSSRFKPRLELSLGLNTPIATEVGLFDYLVSLRANAYMNLYDGLTLSTMYEMPLFHSQNFDDGNIFSTQYKDKLENRLVSAQLHQTLHYESLLNTTSIGRFQENYNGILNQTNLTAVSGEHGLALRVGKFKNRVNSYIDDKNIYIGSYRYFYAPLDLFTEVSYGKYWEQDKGETIQFKRFFGETAVALYLKNTTESFAGFRVTIPLTTRKSNNYAFGQLKGKKDFNYGIGTIVRSNENSITSAIAVTPKTDLELTTHYLDRDRLNASYIKNHLDRMREAYLIYGEE